LYYKAKKRQPVFTKYSLYTLQSNSLFTSEKAVRDLSYAVRPFEQSVTDALAWLKSENII
jgi:dihydroflavonol-4-reductase